MEKISHIMMTSGRVDNWNYYDKKRLLFGKKYLINQRNWSNTTQYFNDFLPLYLKYMCILRSLKIMFILHRSLGEQRRNMESMHIAKENQAILFRLSQRKAHYSVRSWNKDWLETVRLMDSIACFPQARTNQAKVTILILCYGLSSQSVTPAPMRIFFYAYKSKNNCKNIFE